MNYPEYFKEKIINLYFQSEKIGKHTVNINDFKFLNKIFNNYEIKKNIYSISEILQYIIIDFKNNHKLLSKIGFDFLDTIQKNRAQANFFLEETPLSPQQINKEQKIDLENKYIEVANKYGLKEFYYTLNSNLTPFENYAKAMLLLQKTEVELNKLQVTLNMKESYKIGNNILSIQVNWQNTQNNHGYYNFCSNTICLKDENTVL